MKGGGDVEGCFPTGRPYPGIAHLLRVAVHGLAREWEADTTVLRIPWMSIDTETTGRDPATAKVVEVGCVRFEDGQVVDKKNWLIHPGCPIPPETTEVHGIKDEDVADKPRFGEVLPEIVEFMRGGVPMAYNANYDRTVLLSELARLDSRLGDLPPALREDVVWIDPLTWSRELLTNTRYRLVDVAEKLGVSLENAHRATDDAEAAGYVMTHLVRDERVPPTYGPFLREQIRLDKLGALQRASWRRR